MYQVQVAQSHPSNGQPSSPLSDYDKSPEIWRTMLATKDRVDAHRRMAALRDAAGWPVVRVRDGKVTETIQQRTDKPASKCRGRRH